MGGSVLDNIDEQILYALQVDARNSTATDLAADLDVSASTVSNRISQLEADGIVTGYRATVDYEQAGFPLHALIVCTAPISERSSLAAEALEVPGVVSVSELMLGEGNVQVEVVGRSIDDLAQTSAALDAVGLDLRQEVLVYHQSHHPLSYFSTDESSPSTER